MLTLREDGLTKVRAGVTSIAEARPRRLLTQVVRERALKLCRPT